MIHSSPRHAAGDGPSCTIEHRNVHRGDCVIHLPVCSVRAWLPGMSVDPLTYIAVKFPAPVCNACGIPMWAEAEHVIVKLGE